MLKFVIFAVAAFALFKLFTGDRKKKEQQEAKKTEKMAATGQMIKDPVCGAYVPVDTDVRVRSGDTVYGFCSYDCRDKFLKQLEAEEDNS